ncbi:MAG: hypothetical protein LBH65_05115, partial [Desulfovibrio sp.]|nr:hypothetical protein [Desulfovibrio sp.]
ADRIYLTDEDSVFEVNFDHQYKIYENLTAVLELGWLRLDSDKATWSRYKNDPNRVGKFHEHDDAWKAQISFRYSF